MNVEFAPILRGLMDNRNLTRRTLSRAAGRAESTINQLTSGSIGPTAEILRDIAPAMQMDIKDLLVIAGLLVDLPPTRPAPWPEIGSLLAAASHLAPEQIDELTQMARRFSAQSQQ
jgi:transcriptional regulator with XRE-family HTH domain